MNFSQQIKALQVYADTDIVKKSKKYPQFAEELSQIEVEYSHDLNMAIYATLDDVDNMGVFQVTTKPMLTISFYAYLMPPYESYAEKFYLLWIKLLDENLRLHIGRKYCIVYYHTLCEENYPYHFLVGIFKKLPIYYYAMLHKIYAVGTNFFLRKSVGLFDFGRLFKLFQRKIENIEKIREFAQIAEINKMNVFECLPQKLSTELQLKTQKKLMKEQKMKPKPPQPVAVIAKKTDFMMIMLKNHKLDKDGIPAALAILVNVLKKNPQYLELQGIFRKSGSIEEEEEIIVKLENMTLEDDLVQIAFYGGYVVAGVIKKFFTKLVEPIVPYKLYSRLLGILSQTVVKPEQQVSFILDFLSQLPALNKKIVVYLISFLKEEVISRQAKNKMNNYNMSVCFCPCLFRSLTPTLADLLNSGKFAGILNIYFNRFAEVMLVQERSSSSSDGESARPGSQLQHFRISMA